MTRAEQYAWLSLVTLGIIYAWFQMRMLDGWRVVDQPASELLWVYFVVLGLSAAAEIAIAVFLDARKDKRIERDERDLAIAARVGEHERLFIIIAVNVLIWQALWEGAMEDHRLPKIDVTNLPTLFFVLFTILFVGEAVKRLSTIWLYRLQSVQG